MSSCAQHAVGPVFRLLISVVLFCAAICSHGQAAPTVPELLRKGASMMQDGDMAAASSLFQQVVKLDPSNGEAHTYLGVIADAAGDLRAAEKHFAAAVKSGPNSVSARNNHGA